MKIWTTRLSFSLDLAHIAASSSSMSLWPYEFYLKSSSFSSRSCDFCGSNLSFFLLDLSIFGQVGRHFCVNPCDFCTSSSLFFALTFDYCSSSSSFLLWSCDLWPCVFYASTPSFYIEFASFSLIANYLSLEPANFVVEVRHFRWDLANAGPVAYHSWIYQFLRR